MDEYEQNVRRHGQIREVRAFQTRDGEVFKTFVEAQRHDAQQNLKDALFATGMRSADVEAILRHKSKVVMALNDYFKVLSE